MGLFFNLSDVYPALDDLRPDMRSELSVLQHGVHHAGGDRVELGDGCTYGGSTVLVVLLVSMGPDGAQAMVGDHLLKQQLERKDTKKLIRIRAKGVIKIPKCGPLSSNYT